jgi:hypothetical protein
VRAASRTFYRIGDSAWQKYVVAGLWPVTSDTDGEDRALLLRHGADYAYRIPADFSACWLVSGGREWAYSPWPPEYAPPFVRLLASDRAEDWDVAGFVPAEYAQPGAAKLPPDVHMMAGTT